MNILDILEKVFVWFRSYFSNKLSKKTLTLDFKMENMEWNTKTIWNTLPYWITLSIVNNTAKAFYIREIYLIDRERIFEIKEPKMELGQNPREKMTMIPIDPNSAKTIFGVVERKFNYQFGKNAKIKLNTSEGDIEYNVSIPSDLRYYQEETSRGAPNPSP